MAVNTVKIELKGEGLTIQQVYDLLKKLTGIPQTVAKQIFDSDTLATYNVLCAGVVDSADQDTLIAIAEGQLTIDLGTDSTPSNRMNASLTADKTT